MSPVALWLDEPIPGVAGVINTVTVHRVAPHARVVLTYGLREGETVVPRCPGATLGIEQPRVGGVMIADQDGIASGTFDVAMSASGRTVRIQCVEPGRCRVSQVLEFKFD